MRTVYLVRCLQCRLKPARPFDDPGERDNAAIEHYQKYGHRKLRRWTEDRFIDNPIEDDE